MSQYRRTVSSNQGSVDVLIGWDKPLNYFFMVIGTDLDDPYYSNLNEPDGLNLTLDYYQTILDKLGIKEISLKPESKLAQQLQADQRQGQ